MKKVWVYKTGTPCRVILQLLCKQHLQDLSEHFIIVINCEFMKVNQGYWFKNLECAPVISHFPRNGAWSVDIRQEEDNFKRYEFIQRELRK